MVFSVVQWVFMGEGEILRGKLKYGESLGWFLLG